MNGAAALRVTDDDWSPSANVWGTRSEPVPAASSAFDLRGEPLWLEPTARRLGELLRLRDNWDAQGGAAIRRTIVTSALQLLRGIMHGKTTAPQIVPLANGSLQLEWHENGIDLEIEIIGPAEMSVLFEDHHHPEKNFEDELSIDFSVLQYPIARLTP